MASRLNHSCRGGENARWEWSEEEGLMRFWTDRDIEVGKEFRLGFDVLNPCRPGEL